MKEGIGVLGGHVEPRQHALAATVDVAHEIDLVALLGVVRLVDVYLVHKERQRLALRPEET